MKHVLVTGGAGFIGSHLVEALVKQGYRTTVIDDLSSGSLENLAPVKGQIEFVNADISDAAAVEQAMAGCDSVFHLAAMVSVPQTVREPLKSAMINEVGTLNVLEAARKAWVKRVVLSSSCAVYGDNPKIPQREDQPLKPVSPYAVQKAAGEQYAAVYHRLHGLETVSLRYFNVYGPRQDPRSPYSGVISIFMTKALTGESPVIYGDGLQYRDFIFVKDVVRANLLAATATGAAGKVFNIGTGLYVPINRLWEDICEIAGIRLSPRFEAPRPGDIRQSVAAIDEACYRMDFKPEVRLKKGLEETFQWYRQQQEPA